MKKKAVVLFNLGGPSKLEDVKPFLFNLFSDKAIIPLPNPFRWFLAKFISNYREKFSKEIYKSIGGGSPILALTKQQGESLELELNGLKKEEYKVFVSMRYWHPFSEEVVKKLEDYNPDEILLLPLYPQFSTTTTESSLQDFYKSISNSKLKDVNTRAVCCFYTDDSFIQAHVSLIKETIKKEKIKTKETVILFSAHGLPISVIEKGDPYEEHVKKTVALVVESLNVENLNYEICYQSKVGPKKWLSPSTENKIIEIGKQRKAVMIIPVSFVSEHSETLAELDKEYREIATKNGVKGYYRVKALGVNEFFVASLKKICLKLSGVKSESRRLVVSSSLNRLCPKDFCKCINNYKG